MESFKRILVDVDATAIAHPALERAVRLARHSGATLTIVDVLLALPYARRYLPATFKEELISDRRQKLARIADSVTGVRAEAKLLFGRPAAALIQEVLRSKHDLLMRSHTCDDRTTPGPKPFGAVDMELLRKCPCPVFLARHDSPAPHHQIAAAVNASSEEPEEQALNAKIVELALFMASSLEASLPRLLQAWTPIAETTARGHLAPDQFDLYVEDARQRAASGITRLIQSFEGTAALQPTLRRGEPRDAIPEFVVAEGIDLLVMGTVARAGIAGMLIGNTAERVLGKLPCSVLTGKPDGFVSPVPLGPAAV